MSHHLSNDEKKFSTNVPCTWKIEKKKHRTKFKREDNCEKRYNTYWLSWLKILQKLNENCKYFAYYREFQEQTRIRRRLMKVGRKKNFSLFDVFIIIYVFNKKPTRRLSTYNNRLLYQVLLVLFATNTHPNAHLHKTHTHSTTQTNRVCRIDMVIGKPLTK